MDEQELIERVKKGDEMAFTVLMKAYKDRLVNFLYHSVGDYERAVELAQETFVRVYFRAHQYRPIAPLGTWIFTIASNLAKSEAKKRRKINMVSLEEVAGELGGEGVYYDPPSSGLSRNLEQALKELPAYYRIPLLLKDVEGFSQEEIAKMLNRPVGTIKARLSRARHLLRQKLEKALKGETE
ncbi:MAG: sigma-70 family RNA polymerase sigma factor [Candidatus Aminicenantes bacterium]|nr:sigma-70 family RNA polymerase sigma factor [Candidatus Aminicenantes bacterium]